MGYLDVWRTVLLVVAFVQIGTLARLALRGREIHLPVTFWAIATWAVLLSYVFTGIATNYDEYLNWRCPLATLALTVSAVGLVEALRRPRVS